MRSIKVLVASVGIVVAGVAFCNAETTLPTTMLDQEFVRIRSDYSIFAEQQQPSTDFSIAPHDARKPKRLSPGKAFAMSLLVPGLGQYYAGSKVKAAGFFALDVTSWVLHFKYRSDGNTLTDKFELFQQTYWSRSSYRTYLLGAYGKGDDDSITAPEVSHHLPDSATQQYYEMTGKYDQFAWGWDDATVNDSSLLVFADSVRPAVGADIPISPHRDAYETMRYNANRKFDASDKWVIVSLANHVISAFEAMIYARHKNKGRTSGGEFGRITVRADLRSYTTVDDTPYLQCAFSF
jgi:hypothetical protein